MAQAHNEKKTSAKQHSNPEPDANPPTATDMVKTSTEYIQTDDRASGHHESGGHSENVAKSKGHSQDEMDEEKQGIQGERSYPGSDDAVMEDEIDEVAVIGALESVSEIVDEEQKPVRPGKMTPHFDMWYSIAPGDVKVNSNAVKDGLNSRIKSFDVFSDFDSKHDKPENKIGRLLMREIVHLENNKEGEPQVTDFSTILELMIHKNCEKVERGFGVQLHASGGPELELAASGSAVTKPDDVKEKITKNRIGHVTSRPEKSRFPKLGEHVRVSITTFPGKLYKKLTVKLKQHI